MVVFNYSHKIKLKKLITLKINALYNFKILKFKKLKWKKFLQYFRKELAISKYKKYKIIDQMQTLLNKTSIFELNYKNQYFKKWYCFSKIFDFFFGNFPKNYYKNLKNKIKISSDMLKKTVIEFLESRLDLVLYKSKFCSSIKSAKRVIMQGHVNVNGSRIKNCLFLLKSGDLISFSFLIKNNYSTNLVHSKIWPTTPAYLIVNYKTAEIVFLGNLKKTNSFLFYSFFYLNLHKIFNN
jgi:ribosomal protein S4